MAYDALPDFDLAGETDAVIATSGLAPTKSNLNLVAEEMERRLRLHPRGVVQAGCILREIRRRALAVPT
jgi:hypothetical protein